MAEIPGIRGVVTQRIVSKAEEKAPEVKAFPSSPIGVFDSGVGGLTVLREVIKELKLEDVIYLADTARVPFGGRAEQEIIKINEEIIEFLIENEVKLIIMACGTSSAVAYPVLKEKYKIPMIEIIGPGARAAVSATKNLKIGVLATVRTAESGAFGKAIRSIKKEAEVHEIGCPLFVPLIEGGFVDADETKRHAREYIKPLIEAKVDTVILGCTHYPHLLNMLKELAPGITFIDPAVEVVLDTKKILKKEKLQNKRTGAPRYQYFVTGSAISFQDLGSKLLGKPIAEVKQISLIKGRT